EPFLLAGLLMVTVLHTFSGVAFPAAQYVLATLKAVIFGAVTFNRIQAASTRMAQELIGNVPADLRTIIDMLQLGPDIVQYACC
ncbi:hypothetical protein C8Q79DRAFT_876325, partial [Trametes meyenii]